MKAKDVLQKARKRIEDPAHWTQGAFARNAYGVEVLPDFHTAVCWCAKGAIYATIWETSVDLGDQQEWDALTVLNLAVGPDHHHDVVLLNDSTDHATVLAAFDRAIQQLEAPCPQPEIF